MGLDNLTTSEAGVKRVVNSSISHDFTEPLSSIFRMRDRLEEERVGCQDFEQLETLERVSAACATASRIERTVEAFVNGPARNEPAEETVRRFRKELAPWLTELRNAGVAPPRRANTAEEQDPTPLEVVYEASTQLYQMIAAMQSFVANYGRRSRSGEALASLQQANPIEFVDRVLRQIGPRSEDVLLRNRTRRSADLPTLLLDHGQVRTALQNLVLNGIKYADHAKPTPWVEVEVAVRKLDEFSNRALKSKLKRQGRFDWLTFTVSDNGVGIEPRELSRVQRLNTRGSNAKGVSGQGLGLAIVQAYAVDHGGTLFLESERRKGTVAYFVIPAREDPAGARP